MISRREKKSSRSKNTCAKIRMVTFIYFRRKKVDEKIYSLKKHLKIELKSLVFDDSFLMCLTPTGDIFKNMKNM